jgi:hypothetical protein
MPAAASTRFHVDLLHPGRVPRSWQGWVTGSHGGRRLALVTLAGALVLLVVLFAAVLPASRRLAVDFAAVPGLTSDLAARDTELRLLRSSLQSLSQEARRQVRWADVLTTLSQQTPPGLKLQLVEVGRVAPPAGSSPPAGATQGAAAAAGRAEETLRIEAFTPARPGGPPLVDVAQFMAGLMRDPAVSRRFALKSWEIKPSAITTAGGDQVLAISIVLTERAQ